MSRREATRVRARRPDKRNLCLRRSNYPRRLVPLQACVRFASPLASSWRRLQVEKCNKAGSGSPRRGLWFRATSEYARATHERGKGGSGRSRTATGSSRCRNFEEREAGKRRPHLAPWRERGHLLLLHYLTLLCHCFLVLPPFELCVSQLIHRRFTACLPCAQLHIGSASPCWSFSSFVPGG